MQVAEADHGPEALSSAARLNHLFRSLDTGRGIAVALSGGADSTALLHLLLEWLAAGQRQIRLVALTVDHGLRPESAAEAAAVAKTCARLGVEHHTLTWLSKGDERPATAIQARARAARYGLMSDWCKEHAIDMLLTAHTAEDQAETVLMRARRTNSPESLAAIWARTEWNGVAVLRPLLEVRRSALRQYLRERRVSWIEDPSNANRRFERVRVRQELAEADVPQLADIARRAQQQVRRLMTAARQFMDQHLSEGLPGALTFPLDAFLSGSDEVRLAVLQLLIKQFSCASRPERAEAARLLAWIAGASGARRSLAGLLFARRGPNLVVGREPGRIAPEWQVLPASGEMVWDGRYHIAGPVGLEVGPVFLANDRLANDCGASSLQGGGLQRPSALPHWLWRGLPAVRMPSGEVLCALALPQALWQAGADRHINLIRNDVIEQLGIRATPTYVKANQSIRWS